MVMDHRSKASRDLAAYIEKRDAALARARQLRLLKQMGNDERSEEPSSRLKPIQTLSSYSEKKSDMDDVYTRLNELENNYRSMKSENTRLQQTVQKLSQKVTSLEQQLKDSGTSVPLKSSFTSSSSTLSAEGYEPPSSVRKSGRRARNASPPPMDFTLDPSNDESPGFATPPRTRRSARPTRRLAAEPSPVADQKPPAVGKPPTSSSFDDFPISPAGESSTNNFEPNAVQDRPEPLFPCSTCGRRFRAESLQKHTVNCVKVFQTKRKEFKVEILNEEDAKELRQVYRPSQPSPAKKGIPKWRQDRARLRSTLLNGSGSGPQEVVQDTRVTCPHCSRKFDEAAADRHIPKCKNVVNKPAMLLRKPTRF